MRRTRRSLLFCAIALFFAIAATKSVAQRTLGCDVSGYQPSVNWNQVTNAGMRFCWTKATEGTYYINPYFTAQESGAKSAGVYIGAYHFARPSDDPNITGANSADTEANYFWLTASNYVKGGGVYMVPVLDWEDTGATVAAGFTETQMSQWVIEWCNTVSNLARANGVIVKPLVYTGTWYSVPSSTYPGLNSTVTGISNWISAYNGESPQTGGPSSESPWSTWNFWQYDDTNTSVANWTGGDVDVYPGSVASLVSTYVINGISFTGTPLNLAADAGGSVSFTNTASGQAPIHYQWIFNGVNILNATNAILSLTNLQTTNAGLYAVIATNSTGSTTSSPASLLVYPLQATVFADNFDTNSAANWTVNNSSSDTAIAFNYDYSALGIASAPHSTGGTTRGVQMKVNLKLGLCAAMSISPKSQSFSGDYRLHFDGWINVNGPLPGGGASSTEYLTCGIGTAGNRVEWTTNASADGYYFSADGDGGVSAGSTGFGDYSGYIGNNFQNTATGIYAAGSQDNAASYYTTAFPIGASPPALQQANYSQQTGSLATGTIGLGWHDFIVSRRGSTVNWIVDGVQFATISNATFSANNVFVGFWDPFASLTDNTNLSFGVVDNLRVEEPAIAPQFTLQPAPKTVVLGTNVTFTAAASGLPAASYQWQFNGTNISGATNATYSLAFVAQTNVGNYSVIATNIAGSTNSTSAALALVSPDPAQFTGVTLQNGALQVGFTGDAYWTYTVQVSTNLTDWSAFTNMTSTNGIFNFVVGTTNTQQQFFRASVGP